MQCEKEEKEWNVAGHTEGPFQAATPAPGVQTEPGCFLVVGEMSKTNTDTVKLLYAREKTCSNSHASGIWGQWKQKKDGI